MRALRPCLWFCLSLLAGAAFAGDVEVVGAKLEAGGGTWRASVTLEHADVGWEHYADAWRVVDATGNVLGTRTLHHPHVGEQPFTRSLGGIVIPASVDRVYIEAHDSVHGWSPARLPVDLAR